MKSKHGRLEIIQLGKSYVRAVEALLELEERLKDLPMGVRSTLKRLVEPVVHPSSTL